MSDADAYVNLLEKNSARLSEIAEKVWSAARPGAVFGEPVTSGEYTVITASEVGSGGGFGSGMGFGPEQSRQKILTEPVEDQQPREANAGGGGFGGGGGAGGRPVAVITLGPDGVKIKPVVDVTKLALAGITAWGGMALALWGMQKAKKP